jgi:hypothetical protein
MISQIEHRGIGEQKAVGHVTPLPLIAILLFAIRAGFRRALARRSAVRETEPRFYQEQNYPFVPVPCGF